MRNGQPCGPDPRRHLYACLQGAQCAERLVGVVELPGGERRFVNRLVYALTEVGRLGNVLPFLGRDGGRRYLCLGPRRDDLVSIHRVGEGTASSSE
jgi:hypothetical protein